MSVQLNEAVASARALAVAGAELVDEPDWIARAADEYGYGWARVAWKRAAARPGAWFDTAKADKVVALWPKVFKLTRGRFAGKPFVLRFWQECIVRLLVGWKEPIDVIDEVTGLSTQLYVRVFRELRLWIARKNGKSEFLAALALLFWALEGEVRGQGFCFAHNEEQAHEVFDKMSDMVGMAPALSKDITTFAKSLWIQTIKASFRLLTGKAAGKHGAGATVTVGDEMHVWKSRDLADTLRQGEGAATQPIRLYSSSAGLRSQKTGVELFDESQKILDGTIDDPTTLVAIFAVPDDVDWRNETHWPLANPSLGLSPTLAFLRGEAAKARNNPRAEAQFRCYHLTQFVDEVSRWLTRAKWDACASDANGWKAFPQALKGRECVAAFDATKSFDFASLCLRFPPLAKDERTKLVWRFWLPAETIAERTRTEKVAFDRWRDDGALEEIPGATFVLSWAIKAAREACRDYKVTRIGYDPWNALEFYNRLVAPDDDAPALPEDLLCEMRFGTRTLGAATKEFERKVFAGELDHGNNPVARWMSGHCHVRFDDNMNFVPAKKRSEQSIDGIVAAVMDEALATAPASIAAKLNSAILSRGGFA